MALQEPGNGPPQLRPLSIGEVLDVAVKLVVRNFGPVAIVTLLVLLPLALLQVIVFSAVIDTEAVDGEVGFVSDSGAIGATVVTVLLSALGNILVTVAVFRLLAGAYLGERVRWQASLAFAGKRLHSAIWLAILYGLLVVIGFILLFLPGIFIAVALSVSFVALCVEDKRGTKALRRSFGLVRGRWWATFAILLLALLIIIVVSIVFGLLSAAVTAVLPTEAVLPLLLVNQLVGLVGSLVTDPLLAAVLVVLYLDLRVRKEGFDLRVLADQLEGRASEPVAPAPPSSAFGA